MNCIASWSGGKDSCFACYKAMQEGYEVSYLVNFISEEYKRVRFHGTEAKLIGMQAEAIGIELVQQETTAQGYEQEFKEAVRAIKGIEGMVFGDMYLQEHKDWTERVCGELGIESIEPIWGRDTEDVITEFIDAGFKAVIVSANSEMIDKEWVGRRVNKEFVGYLKEKNIEVCGENGEYHTLVIDGPIFKKRIEIKKSRTIKREGYWLLDTVEVGLNRKGKGTE